jgi:hypothetical protein
MLLPYYSSVHPFKSKQRQLQNGGNFNLGVAPGDERGCVDLHPINVRGGGRVISTKRCFFCWLLCKNGSVSSLLGAGNKCSRAELPDKQTDRQTDRPTDDVFHEYEIASKVAVAPHYYISFSPQIYNIPRSQKDRLKRTPSIRNVDVIDDIPPSFHMN